MLEAVERYLGRALEKLLGHPVVIGVPDPRWYRAQGIPAASLKVGRCSYLDWISSGVPESEVDAPDNKVKQTWAVAEVRAAFVLHLFDTVKSRIEQQTFKLGQVLGQVNNLSEFCSFIARLADNPGLLLLDESDSSDSSDPSDSEIPDWSTGLMDFEDSDPGPEDERVFERIISIQLSGNLTRDVLVDKRTLEWELAVSPEAET